NSFSVGCNISFPLARFQYRRAKNKRAAGFACGPFWEIGFAMNYKAGAQAGASRCQRHHPAQTFRLERFILKLMIHAMWAIVNPQWRLPAKLNDSTRTSAARD